MPASLIAFLIVWFACTRAGIDASPATLAAALALALSRDTARVTWTHVCYRLIGLPVIAIAAGAVGVAFTRLPLVAALAFTVAVAGSVYVRRFGRAARALGRIIALPFIAMLAVPVPAHTPAVAVIAAGIVAVIVTSVLQLLAPPKDTPSLPERKSRTGIDPSTRMAIHMFVALALAFACGFLILPQHWFWVVLTAFIVCSGAVARGDAVYKAVLRLGGALAGTAIAAAVAPLLVLQPPIRAAVIFAVLFAATSLRKRNYAYWAAGATLIFALLQSATGTPELALFVARGTGIVIGALCAVAATWFVLPVRTRNLIKLRRAQLFAALKLRDRAVLEHRLRELERASQPLVLAARAREFLHLGENARYPMERSVTVYVSAAMTIDGYIDDRRAQRLVLSNDDDMHAVRSERASCDAILVGANTVRSDNPSLRTNQGLYSPARVTVTQSGNLDRSARFFDRSARTIVLCGRESAGGLQSSLGDSAEVHALDGFEPSDILNAVARAGIRSLFIEGGTRVLTSFLAAGSFDRLRLAVAPFFAGDTGSARLVDPATFFDGPEHRLLLIAARAVGDMAILEYERQRG
jgi:riboflavin-specific deaminase-like protein